MKLIKIGLALGLLMALSMTSNASDASSQHTSKEAKDPLDEVPSDITDPGQIAEYKKWATEQKKQRKRQQDRKYQEETDAARKASAHMRKQNGQGW